MSAAMLDDAAVAAAADALYRAEQTRTQVRPASAEFPSMTIDDAYRVQGEIILAGSFTRPVAAAAGDVIEADFGALGVLGCRFD